MKKVLTAVLVLALSLTIFGCKANDTPPKPQLEAGFSKINITPDFTVGLGGYDNADKRLATGKLDDLFLTCIALREGEETILLFTVDSCALSKDSANSLRRLVESATGIPGDKQIYGATHTHSAPSYNSAVTGGTDYLVLMSNAAIQAAEESIADLAPAKGYYTAPQVPKMTFDRNYTRGADGQRTYLNGSDDTMVLLKFDREEKQDILLVNFQSHPDHSSMNGFYNISADFPGALRDKVAAETGMLVAYYNGASGNLTPFSQIPEDSLGYTMPQYGQALADKAIAALPSLQPITGSGIATKRVTYAAEVDHSLDHKVLEAREVYEYFQLTDISTSRPLANKYGFQSAYQARAVISRANMGPSIAMDTFALRVGDIGFIGGTYEMYATASCHVRENSPFAATVVICGNHSYVASEAAFDSHTYEAITGYYAKGTSEKMAEHYVSMLKELGDARGEGQ